MQRVIRQGSELQGLKARLGRHGITRIVLRLPGYPADLRRAEYHINRNLRPASVRWGAAFGAIALMLFALVVALLPDPLRAQRALLIALAAAVGTAVGAGRIYAHWLAARRLRRTVDWIAARTAEFAEPLPDHRRPVAVADGADLPSAERRGPLSESAATDVSAEATRPAPAAATTTAVVVAADTPALP
ncbi:MAG TPA: hypothetical protein VFR86_01490 [Burkholderiaceae bacterium]|nr:hypothetical protein [Burkholderiaceae bacterium]